MKTRASSLDAAFGYGKPIKWDRASVGLPLEQCRPLATIPLRPTTSTNELGRRFVQFGPFWKDATRSGAAGMSAAMPNRSRFDTPDAQPEDSQHHRGTVLAQGIPSFHDAKWIAFGLARKLQNMREIAVTAPRHEATPQYSVVMGDFASVVAPEGQVPHFHTHPHKGATHPIWSVINQGFDFGLANPTHIGHAQAGCLVEGVSYFLGSTKHSPTDIGHWMSGLQLLNHYRNPAATYQDFFTQRLFTRVRRAGGVSSRYDFMMVTYIPRLSNTLFGPLHSHAIFSTEQVYDVVQGKRTEPLDGLIYDTKNDRQIPTTFQIGDYIADGARLIVWSNGHGHGEIFPAEIHVESLRK